MSLQPEQMENHSPGPFLRRFLLPTHPQILVPTPRTPSLGPAICYAP